MKQIVNLQLSSRFLRLLTNLMTRAFDAYDNMRQFRHGIRSQADAGEIFFHRHFPTYFEE